MEAAIGRGTERAGTGESGRLADDSAAAVVCGRAGDHRRALLGAAAQGGPATGPGRRSPRLGLARQPRPGAHRLAARQLRSEEHTSELQSLMRISYAVFCLKKKKRN